MIRSSVSSLLEDVGDANARDPSSVRSSSDPPREGYVNEDELGSSFWLICIGFALAVGVGTFLVFALIGGAWYRWGAFGALIFCSGLTLLVAWLYDRHTAKRRSPPP